MNMICGRKRSAEESLVRALGGNDDQKRGLIALSSNLVQREIDKKDIDVLFEGIGQLAQGKDNNVRAAYAELLGSTDNQDAIKNAISESEELMKEMMSSDDLAKNYYRYTGGAAVAALACAGVGAVGAAMEGRFPSTELLSTIGLTGSISAGLGYLAKRSQKDKNAAVESILKKIEDGLRQQQSLDAAETGRAD